MRRSRLGSWGVLGAGLLALPSCALLRSSGPIPPDYLLHQAGAPRIRSCRFVDDPGTLPSFETLARPGTRGSLALISRDMSARDSVEFSARYDEDGRLVWVRAIRSSVPTAVSARVEDMLQAGLNPDGPADWGFRMMLVGGDIAAVAPSVRCPAELRSTVHDLVSAPVASTNRLDLPGVRGRPYRAWISLDERGRVTGIRMDATSGSRLEDELIIQYLLSLTYEPQLHDGIAVPATVRELIYIPDAGY